MGFYLNTTDSIELYRNTIRSPYFVDKSSILAELNELLNTEMKYICITRPRRFGKSIAATMIGTYYSKGGDAADIFAEAKISECGSFREHLNCHNVIYIDFSSSDDSFDSYNEYINAIKEILRADLHTAYPEVEYRKNGSVMEDLQRITQTTGEKFIFVFDEWDAVFHMRFVTEEDRDKYLLFLKYLLKGKSYVELAYMTGILPISKYSSGSELNMFAEYTMASQEKFGDYFGFTETEVDELYQKYLKKVKIPKVTREEIRAWYDGYFSFSGERLYNPRSVVLALMNNQLSDYWTSSGPYDEIFYYIKHNIADVRDDIAVMLAGASVTANVKEYAAISMELKTRDQILSAMLVYGFLTCRNNELSIPNKELMDKFVETVRTEESLGYVYRLAKASEQMLAATLNGDTETMEKILKQAHDTETGMIGYNNETELSAIIKLVYLAARDRYDIQREDKAGVGYVDYIFYPVLSQSDDCIILELKVDHSADEAIRQIKDRNYIQRFLGKVAERPRYTGRILAVGIGYQKNSTSKEHECKVEILREI